METHSRWPCFPRLDQPQKKASEPHPTPPTYYSCKRDEFNPPLQKRDSRAVGGREEGRKLQQQHADSGMNESVSVSLPKSNQMIRFNLLTPAVRRSSHTGGERKRRPFHVITFSSRRSVCKRCLTELWRLSWRLFSVFLREELYLQFDEAFLAGSNVFIHPVKLFCHLNDFCHGEHFYKDWPPDTGAIITLIKVPFSVTEVLFQLEDLTSIEDII